MFAFISRTLGFFTVNSYIGIFYWSFIVLGLFLVFYHAFIRSSRI